MLLLLIYFADRLDSITALKALTVLLNGLVLLLQQHNSVQGASLSMLEDALASEWSGQ